jgi:hypothetical protein
VKTYCIPSSAKPFLDTKRTVAAITKQRFTNCNYGCAYANGIFVHGQVSPLLSQESSGGAKSNAGTSSTFAANPLGNLLFSLGRLLCPRRLAIYKIGLSRCGIQPVSKNRFTHAHGVVPFGAPQGSKR